MKPILRMTRAVACAVFLLIIGGGSPSIAQSEPDIAGTPPTLVRRTLSAVPNEAAIVTRIWAPALDEGFIPQGMAWHSGGIALSGSVSVGRDQSQGPCQVIWMSPSSGAITRRLALPRGCGHAGGLAALADGRLVVADTRALFVIRDGAVSREISLRGALRGSFADFDGKDLWIGSYDRSGGRLWRFPLAALDQAQIDESAAIESLQAPANAQGLAFDRSGQLWMTTSSSRSGEILRLDRKTGQVLARHPAPAGIEDIAFDGQGRLWASSEAGSRRWSSWATFYPLVFAVDIARLR
jgi:outer membrane protein assembly factor BamB